MGFAKEAMANPGTVDADITGGTCPETDENPQHPSTGTGGGGARTVTAGDQITDWGFDLLGGNYLGDVDGSGATVAVLDSGFDLTHPDFEDAVVATEVFVGNDITDEKVVHGTPVAGVIGARDNGTGTVGIAPGADLALGKIADSAGGWAYSYNLAAGIVWAVEDIGADVINLSYGGPLPSDTIRRAADYARRNGVVLVVSAGNDGRCNDCVGYPAAHDSALAVSALHRTMDVTSFSSTGPEIDLIAPGESVSAPAPGGGRNDHWRGTSFAAPYTAGVAALLASLGHDADEIIRRLKQGTVDIGLSSNAQGEGRLDAWRAVTEMPPVRTVLGGRSSSGTVPDFDIQVRDNTVRFDHKRIDELIEPYFVAYLPAAHMAGDEGVERPIWPDGISDEEMVSIGHTENLERAYDTRETIEVSPEIVDRIDTEQASVGISGTVLLMDSDWGRDDAIETWEFQVPYEEQEAPETPTETSDPTAEPTPEPTPTETAGRETPTGTSTETLIKTPKQTPSQAPKQPDSETPNANTPGFGFMSALTSLGGVGYLLLSRLRESDD
jgi:subtilisin